MKTAIAVLLSMVAAPAFAQDLEEPTLAAYLDAMSEARLLAPETGSLALLRTLLARGEALAIEGRHDEAALVLFEITESPAFSDWQDTDDFAAAGYALAGSLEALGAWRTAARAIERVLEHGPSPHFAPAVRRYVDVALASGDLDRAATFLTELQVPVDPDAQNELRYLRGRALYDQDALPQADAAFAGITRRSRFYASALYLRGAIAARGGDLAGAEAHFCAVTEARHDPLSFYVDERFFEVEDLARLGLGRVAHEAGRAADAFYYYFQVPNDSPRVAEALFESAFAMYEGGDHATALDLLDQLEARFPDTPFADEATLLRGYVALAHCEFERADAAFRRFRARFGPVLAEARRVLGSPARRARVFEDLLREQRAASGSRERRVLLSLLRVDPEFFHLHESVRALDAETARSGRLLLDLQAIEARARGETLRPAAVIAPRETGDVRATIEGLSAQLDAMRAAGASPRELAEIDAILIRASESLPTEVIPEAPELVTPPAPSRLFALLGRDLHAVRAVNARAIEVRRRLIAEANAVAVRGLEALVSRLGTNLRRARIGRIDAVMGQKRHLEIEIEQLSLGELPPELVDPLRVQGLLRDDEEYWPFEGEDWPDEFEEAE